MQCSLREVGVWKKLPTKFWRQLWSKIQDKIEERCRANDTKHHLPGHPNNIHDLVLKMQIRLCFWNVTMYQIGVSTTSTAVCYDAAMQYYLRRNKTTCVNWDRILCLGILYFYSAGWTCPLFLLDWKILWMYNCERKFKKKKFTLSELGWAILWLVSSALSPCR